MLRRIRVSQLPFFGDSQGISENLREIKSAKRAYGLVNFGPSTFASATFKFKIIGMTQVHENCACWSMTSMATTVYEDKQKVKCYRSDVLVTIWFRK